MLPNLYFFNPTCELAIANGSPYYTAPAGLRKFEEELAFLPCWLGSENDQVLIRGVWDMPYIDRMRQTGFKLATPVALTDALADQLWMNTPKGKLLPWGYSPAVYQLFQPIMPMLGEQFKESAVARWHQDHKELYSRLTGITFLHNMLNSLGKSWLPENKAIPVVCDSLSVIYSELARHEKAVVKTPWSSSGRGLLLFPNIDSEKKNDQILGGMLNQQGFVTVEPWHQKVMDLSYQFQSIGGKIEYMGRTIFETDRKGKYLRNFLHDTPKNSDEISLFLSEHNEEVISLLSECLAGSSYASQYEGWIGVDSLIYRTAEGVLKFHPVVEVNGRFTMGAIALKIRNYLAPGSTGFMQIYYSQSKSFYDFCLKEEAEKPLVMKDHKIVSGFLPLTPPQRAQHFGAYAEVMSDEL